MNASDPSAAADAQHAMLGIEQERDRFEPTAHADAQWFASAGLGLFVHWGISCVHGDIDLSWGMIANKPWGGNTIPPAAYFPLAERFAPQRYDPDAWLAPAAAAGFRYAVMTTRHHDGYAMWPSEQGGFGTRTHMDGHDLVRPFVDACRRHGLKVGLYYSPPDWYWNRHHMSFNYRGPALGLDLQPCTVAPEPEGWQERYRAYVRAQIIELLTRYHPVDLLWFDGGPPVMSIDEIRRYNPAIVINPRMHGYGDYKTAECKMPEAALAGWWELCEIWPECGWGYAHRGGERYRSLDWMLPRLGQVRRWGGNYLINVAPRPDGTLPDAYYQRMQELIALGGFPRCIEGQASSSASA